MAIKKNFVSLSKKLLILNKKLMLFRLKNTERNDERVPRQKLKERETLRKNHAEGAGIQRIQEKGEIGMKIAVLRKESVGIPKTTPKKNLTENIMMTDAEAAAVNPLNLRADLKLNPQNEGENQRRRTQVFKEREEDEIKILLSENRKMKILPKKYTKKPVLLQNTLLLEVQRRL